MIRAWQLFPSLPCRNRRKIDVLLKDSYSGALPTAAENCPCLRIVVGGSIHVDVESKGMAVGGLPIVAMTNVTLMNMSDESCPS